MRSNLGALLMCLGSLPAIGFFGGPQVERLQAGQSSGVAARPGVAKFVGTWRLVSTEQRDAKGQVIPPATPPAPGRLGFITYDPAGYMGVVIMQGGRQKYAGQQPTPQEARAAVSTYTSYFGPFTVNEAEGYVTHHAQGALSPAMSGVDQKRFFSFSGNRLTLKPPPSPSGNQSSLTWERVPDLANPTPAHKRFIGFWKLVSNERRNAKGELVSSNPGQTGYIIYTASGHMMVHMMQPNRKRYAGQEPTADESMATLSSYTSYFGPYTIHAQEQRPYVVHHRIGHVNPTQIGSDAQRFYEISGRRLMLKPPPTEVDGQLMQGTITWERLSQ
jgi:hypothetical protein